MPIRTRNVVMLLARDLADHISSPFFLVDTEGTLVYFNEPAEGILGQSYAECGPMSRDDWGSHWDPRDPTTGEPVSVEELPLAMAQMHGVAAERALTITTADGSDLTIDVVAFPLIDNSGERIGAAAIFWRDSS